ncbi:MAG: ECF transporter S component [Clostridia bacterium]|nr:ECF transporter S component [Clostridia bacterium]
MIVTLVCVLLLAPAAIALGVSVWDDRRFYIVSLLIILISMLPFFVRFERRGLSASELVLLAAMIAIGVAGRAAFYMIPQFKPAVAVVMITAAAFGPDSGFIAGAMIAFVSNFIFGQGPWTPWQMEAMGVIGYLTGLIFRKKDGSMPPLIPFAAFGGLATFVIYGLIADTSTVFTSQSEINWQNLTAAYASGVVFNLIHAASTVVFLLLLARPMLKKLNRIRVKFGLLE